MIIQQKSHSSSRSTGSYNRNHTAVAEAQVWSHDHTTEITQKYKYDHMIMQQKVAEAQEWSHDHTTEITQKYKYDHMIIQQRVAEAQEWSHDHTMEKCTFVRVTYSPGMYTCWKLTSSELHILLQMHTGCGSKGRLRTSPQQMLHHSIKHCNNQNCEWART